MGEKGTTRRGRAKKNKLKNEQKDSKKRRRKF